MQIKQKLASYSLVAFSILQSCSSSKSIELSFKPVAGKVYNYTITTDQTSNQELMGKSITAKQHMEMYATYTITKTEADDKELTVVYNRIISKQSAMDKEITIDTDNADTTNSVGKLQAGMFNALKGQSFSIILSKDGTVKEVKGFNAILDKMSSQIPGDDKSQEMFKKTMGEDFIKSTFTQAFKIFPNKKVSVGSTWSTKMELKSIFGLKLDNTYTLKSFDDKKASLELQANINTDGDIELMGMKVNADLKGTASGNMELERNTGMVTNSSIHQIIKGNMKIMGIEVPISIDQTVAIKGQPL